MQAKNIVIVVLLIVLLGAVGYLLINKGDNVVIIDNEQEDTEIVTTVPDDATTDESDPLNEVVITERGDESVLGNSVSGNPITAYHFGNGETEILLIGGVHGGYSWNSALLGYELVDYFDANPNLIPNDITVTIVPVLNPDGLEATVGTIGRFSSTDALAVSEATRIAGRFNENTVDINRNFDCDWSKTGTWKSQQVSGGDAPFSEPEAAAVRDYVNTYKPSAAIVWFSAEGKVYPSACESAPSKESIELAATFAASSGYPAEAEFDAYAITGDMVNWMAAQKIPAISVLLTDHKNSETDKNLDGIKAILKAYSK